MTINRLIIVLITYSCLLSITASCAVDEGPYEIYVEVPDLIEIEGNETNFTAGETMWILNTVSRYLPTEESPALLDVFETTEAQIIAYDISLRRQDEFGVYQYYNPAGMEVIIDIGGIDAFGNMASVLNEAEDTYESRIGMVLADPGTYLLTINSLRTSYNINSDFMVWIETNIIDADASGQYEFTVME